MFFKNKFKLSDQEDIVEVSTEPTVEELLAEIDALRNEIEGLNELMPKPPKEARKVAKAKFEKAQQEMAKEFQAKMKELENMLNIAKENEDKRAEYDDLIRVTQEERENLEINKNRGIQEAAELIEKEYESKRRELNERLEELGFSEQLVQKELREIEELKSQLIKDSETEKARMEKELELEISGLQKNAEAQAELIIRGRIQELEVSYGRLHSSLESQVLSFETMAAELKEAHEGRLAEVEERLERELARLEEQRAELENKEQVLNAELEAKAAELEALYATKLSEADDIINLAQEESERVQKEIQLAKEEAEQAAKQELVSRKEELDAEILEMMTDAELKLQKKREVAEEEQAQIRSRIQEYEVTSRVMVKNIERTQKILDTLTTQNQILKNAKTKPTIIVSCILVVFAITISFIFRYALSPKEYMMSALDAVTNSNLFESQISVTVSSSGAEDLYFSITNGINSSRTEEYFNFTLSPPGSSLTWERFNKGDAEFIKIPFEPQYVLAENRGDYNLFFDEKNTQNTFAKAIRAIVKDMGKLSVRPMAIYNTGNVFTDYTLFIKTKLSPTILEYEFEINNNYWLKEFFNVLENGSAYKAFLSEERDLQQRLKLSDTVGEIDSMLRALATNLLVENTSVKVIVEDGKVDSIMVAVRGKNNAGTEIQIFATCVITQIDRDKSYDNPNYTLNSMPFNEVYPRIAQEEYQEAESQFQVIENTTTVRDLIESGYDLNG